MANLTILSFTGDGLIVVQSRVNGTPQQAIIRDAATIGQLAGELNSTFTVRGNGTQPWTLKIQNQLANGSWVDSAIRLGAKSVRGTTPIQLVESSRDVNASPSAAFADLVLRVENSAAVGTSPQPIGLSFVGNARVIVHSVTAAREQRVQIDAAQNAGSFAGVVGRLSNVIANGSVPWYLRFLQKNDSGKFVDRPMTLGPRTERDGIRTQFVFPSDGLDFIVRVEQLIVQTAPADGFVLAGQVTWSTGEPFSGLVRAFDKDLRHEQELGSATTDVDGLYRITYTLSAFDGNEARSADVIVRAVAQQGGQEAVLGQSAVVFNAAPQQIIDFSIPGVPLTGLSEYERIDQVIAPLLDGAQPSELGDEFDVPFLTSETGLAPDKVWLYARANRFSALLGDVPAMAIYGLLRMGAGTDLTTLLENTPEREKEFLTNAGALYAIALDRLGQSPDALVALLQAHRRTNSGAKLRSLLSGGSVNLSDVQIDAVAALDLSHTGTVPEFWNALRQTSGFTPAKVSDVQFAMQAFALADGNLALSKLIQTKRPQGAADARSLLSLNQADWEGLIRTSLDQGGTLPPGLAGVDKDHQITSYARGLMATVEGAFTTTVLGKKIASGPKLDLGAAKKVLAKNPKLDLRQPVPADADLSDFVGPDAIQHALATMAILRGEALAFPQVDLRKAVLDAPPPSPAIAAHVTAAAATSDVSLSALNPVRSGLATVFQQASELDLTSRRAVDFIVQEGAAILATLPADQRPAVETSLKAIQRLSNLVPKPDIILSLLNTGLSSATGIARIAESTFIEQYSSLLQGEPVARAVHRAARRQAAAAATLFTLINRTVNEPNPVALGGAPDFTAVGEELPSWAKLFGEVELSDCANCRSVTGPAAYFVDLLHFLDTSLPPDGTLAPIQALARRRPDLLDLKINCENTHVDVSYVDLVNEILENYLQSQSAGQDALAVLKQSVFPLTLPFDQALESERSYLAQLGLSRAGLLGLFRPPTPASATDAAIEELGIFPGLRSLLVGTSTRPVSDSFGFPNVAGGAWIEELAAPTRFLERTGLTFVELLELIQTPGVRALRVGTSDQLSLQVDGDPADLSQMKILGLSAQTQTRTLENIHRFLRLWRKLRERLPGLGLHELDALLAVLPNTDLSAQLREVSWAIQACADLKLELTPCISLWGSLDTVRTTRVDENGVTVSVPSFYESVFLDPAVMPTLDPDFELPNLKTSTVRLRDKVQALQAALRSPRNDVLAILDDAGPADALLSIQSLSAVYRYPLLARALNLSVAELIALKSLSGVTPFELAENTRAFLSLVRSVNGAGFRVAELAYLFAGNNSLDPSLLPAPSAIDDLARTLSDQFAKIDADTDPTTPDPTGERLRGLVDGLLGTGTQAQKDVEDVISAASAASVAEQAATLEQALPFLVAVHAELVASLGASLGDPSAARKARREFLFPQVLLFLRRTRRRDAIFEAVGANVGLAIPLTKALLGGTALDGSDAILKSVQDPIQGALLDFARPGDPSSADSTLVQQRIDFRRAFRRLQRAALLITRFKLKEAEIRLFQGNVHWQGFDLDALSSEEATASTMLFSGWQAVAHYVAVRRAIAVPLAGALTLIDVFQEVEAAIASSGPNALIPSQVLDHLASATGWDASDVAAIAAARSVTVLSQLANADELVDLQSAIQLTRRAGVGGAKLAEWASADADASQAQAVRDALKSKFDRESFANVVAPLDNQSRDLRREALVGAILALDDIRNRCITSADELFEYFLIDVQMTAVMSTTRLVQAIAAVQLFVQRCLLNLERPRCADSQDPTVSPKAIDADRWKWMKNFRVWEANRKVFLYPENYLEPELRDDKTQFFRELETELAQGTITPDTVESVYLSYLRKLDGVARLEIVAHCRDSSTDVVHLFGRTLDSPPVYYYRRFQEGSWTGWERVPLEIEGDHIAPVVHNHRLFLFWAIFKEKTSNPSNAQLTTPSGSDPGAADAKRDKQPPRRWEVNLAYSEYDHGKWIPKRISNGEKGSFLNDKPATGSLSLVNNRNQAWDSPTSGTSGAAAAPTPNELNDSFSSFLMPVAGNPSRFAPAPERYRLNVSPHPSPGAPLFVNLELEAGNDSSGRAANFLHLGYWNLTRAGASLLAQATFNQAWADNKPAGWSGVAMAWQVPDQLRLLTPVGLLTESNRNIPGTEEALVLGRSNHGRVLFSPQDWVPTFAPPFPPLVFFDGQRSYFVTKRDTSATRWQYDQYLYPRALELLKSPNDVSPTTMRVGRADPGFATSIPAYSGSGLLQSVPRLAFGGYWIEVAVTRAQFSVHYHPYTASLIEALNVSGLESVLTLQNQSVNDNGGTFVNTYQPTSVVFSEFPREDFDFSASGAYSTYNWEIFFHIPLLMAARLSREHQFDEARRWFHFVFDPTTNEVPSPDPALAHLRFWRFLPFHSQSEPARIQDLLKALADPAGDQTLKNAVTDQLAQWSRHPFQPHRIARLRLGAYQKMVIFKYLDNLIAWADQLFAQDTRESINEATQLYVLVSELLGPRPQRIPDPGPPAELSYNELRSRLDAFGNALIEVEDQISTTSFGRADVTSLESLDGDGATVVGLGETLYFCIPQNAKLLSYWDTIADRLFKIRHGLNLQGVARTLALFAPELDVGALVQAAAANLDIGGVVSDLTAPLGFYRFTALMPKALELCNEVKAFGASLLAALEKKDAEALTNLRARHDTGLLELVRRVREQQIEEAELSIAGLEKTRDMVLFRRDYFANLERVNARESEHLAALDRAEILQASAQVMQLIAGVAHATPSYTLGGAGFGGSPVATMDYGGSNIGNAANAAAQVLSILAGIETYRANRSALLGSWDRRSDEWLFQANLADKELLQIDQQIAAAKVRTQIANFELENHDRQLQNAEEVQDFLTSKFTSEDLYGWMTAEVAGLYFQAYQLAYQTAKQVERAYRFERGIATSNFVSFSSWDSLKRGLLAGERLTLDLRRLELAHMQQNARDYELTKTFSLLLHDPVAFVTLKETGSCQFQLPEAAFDLDHPGHFMRRIKSLSLSIPCVAGPYTGVHGTLTLLSSRIRALDDATGDYPEKVPDARFLVDFSAVQSIATSTGQNDTGLFEVSFRDERYLPFEGAGAISSWRLELPKATNGFDFDTITDVVMRVQYTAREGGDALRQKALAAAILPAPATEIPNSSGASLPLPVPQRLARAFSVRHEFADAWNAFLHPADGDTQSIVIDLNRDRFPTRFRQRPITLSGFIVVFKWTDEVALLGSDGSIAYPGAGGALQLDITPPPPGTAVASVSFTSDASKLSGTPVTQNAKVTGKLGTWTFTIPDAVIAALDPALRTSVGRGQRLLSDLVRDVVLIADYTVS